VLENAPLLESPPLLLDANVTGGGGGGASAEAAGAAALCAACTQCRGCTVTLILSIVGSVHLPQDAGGKCKSSRCSAFQLNILDMLGSCGLETGIMKGLTGGRTGVGGGGGGGGNAVGGGGDSIGGGG
jgi:hypothetical protein